MNITKEYLNNDVIVIPVNFAKNPKQLFLHRFFFFVRTYI